MKNEYTEVITNMSDSISEIIYYPQKYTNIIYKDSEHPALFETDIAPGQTYIYENKNERGYIW